MGTYYGLKKGTELFRVIEEVNNKRKELNRVRRELNDRTRDFLSVNRDIRYNYTMNSVGGYIIYITKEDYLLLEDEYKELFETIKRNKYKVKDVNNYRNKINKRICKKQYTKI